MINIAPPKKYNVIRQNKTREKMHRGLAFWTKVEFVILIVGVSIVEFSASGAEL